MLNNFWWNKESVLKFKELTNKIASNVTEKILSTVFSKFVVEKALMPEFNIAYIANWYFRSDYVIE